MVEPKSDTSDMQRLDEMFIHLTPRGASVPYNVCYDPEGNIWVGTKGGLFKFDPEKRTTLWEHKNQFPKKMAPFVQVVSYKDKIIYSCAEDKEKQTELRFYSLNGELQYEQIVDGLFISMVVSDSGDIYVTKQATSAESVIYKTSVDCPIVDWEPLIGLDKETFGTLCVLDDDNLMAVAVDKPTTMFSKQRIVVIDVQTGEITKSFGTAGKEGEQIFFPRAIRKYGSDVVVMDKSGRFLKFDRNGNFLGLLAQIDAFLGNGFCIKDDKALMALSGVVLNEDHRTICDDWLEWISLDGSSWKAQREAAKSQ